MILDYRSSMLLTKLINTDDYISIEVLAEKLSLSKRMIYYDLKKVNMWLEYNNFSPVQNIHTLGLFIQEEEKEEIKKVFDKIQGVRYEYSANERKALIVIHITACNGSVFLNNLIEIIDVSRNTILSDLKELKKEVRKFNVEVMSDRKKGYLLNGTERDIRSCLVFYLSQLINIHDGRWFEWHFQSFDFIWRFDIDEINSILCECERFLNVEYTYEFYSKFSLQLIFFINRIENEKTVKIDAEEKKILIETKEYKAAQYIAERLKVLYKVRLSEDEITYITIHFLCARINNPNSSDVLNENEGYLKKLIKNMVDAFQRFACVNFQQRGNLEKNLLLHLKPAYYRIKYSINTNAPLTNQVMDKYSSLFFLTKKVVQHLEKDLNIELNDDEIAYIAMHFGGWMKKEGLVSPVRKKAIIVCSSGIGTAQLLKIQLDELFSTVDIIKIITLREYENENYEVDFIISTVPLKKKKKYQNVFVVSPILSDLEKELLLSRINTAIGVNDNKVKYIETLMEIIEQHSQINNRDKLKSDITNYIFKAQVEIKEDKKPMLKELLRTDYIKFIDKVDNWEEAIKIASEPLLANEHIEKQYVDAMIDSVREMGPYIVIAPKIAIPHSRPENGVKKIGMSFLGIKNGVSFSEEEKHRVYIMIVLAAIDNETHLKALAQLSSLLSDEKNIEELINANSVDTVIEKVEQYSIK
ncbi:BglG family transcription antiterminator [Paramaledivibacter caminithermalis]|uniref:Transcriptional antiterminator n=1 Tax=Paramaledivibacter caminithermalis (strain DSM 15212 / CIP 107654 / DViRD3) TaxID=1121301 RepID=A0A1M6LY21_PARC5|nr:BglG family transcription antiterminator [Paramaledivibacter caminithermalis]SHJ76082.1 Transcriptional antiterminator [Paramaledivibacter caminithermalis DSM 15212]